MTATPGHDSVGVGARALEARATSAIPHIKDREMFTPAGLAPRLSPEFLLPGQSVSLSIGSVSGRLSRPLLEHLPWAPGAWAQRIVQNAGPVLQPRNDSLI